MKTLVLFSFILAAACSKGPSTEEVKQTVSDMKSGDTAPTKYVSSLQNDVKKAEDVVKKANATQAKIQDGVSGATTDPANDPNQVAQ